MSYFLSSLEMHSMWQQIIYSALHCVCHPWHWKLKSWKYKMFLTQWEDKSYLTNKELTLQIQYLKCTYFEDPLLSVPSSGFMLWPGLPSYRASGGWHHTRTSVSTRRHPGIISWSSRHTMASLTTIASALVIDQFSMIYSGFIIEL